MARLITSGGEVRDHPTADINSPDGITAGAAATVTETTIVRSGSASIECPGTAANSAYRQWAFTAPAGGAQVYGRVYFQVDALPTGLTKIAAFTTSAAGALISARLNTNGTLELWNDAGAAQIGSDSTTVVQTGSWYRLQLRLLINTGAVDQAELLIMDDQTGSTDESITASSLTISDTHAARWQAGWIGAPGATANMWIDDLAVNDSTGTAQNTFPGGGQVYVLPCGNVTSGTSWLDCAGGSTISGFAPYVDNLPPQGLADHSTAGHTGATAHQLRETVNAPGSLGYNTVPWWLGDIPLTLDIYPLTVTITAGATVNVGDATARTRRAQSFTTGGLTADSVSVHAIKTGSPTDNLVAEVQTDNAGLPSGTVVATASMAGSAVQTTAGLSGSAKTTTSRMKFDNPAVLQANTKYWLVVSRSGAIDAANYYSWGRDTVADYPNEAPATFDGTTWVQTGTSHATTDHTFRMTWTQPRPPLRVVATLACHGQQTTGTKAGTLGSTNFNFGNAGAVCGTYPTGWWWSAGAYVYELTITTTNSVALAGTLTKTSATGGVDVCFLGAMVEAGEVATSGGWGRYQKTADSTIWWGKRVFSDTLFETTDVNNPKTISGGDWAVYPDPQITEGQDFPATLVSVTDGGGVPTGYTPA